MASAPVNSTNVLIVEPDHRQTELILELIKNVGHVQVDSTNSGERAIELVSRMPYQLVVADAGISDMDILSILERVKRVSPMTSVILTSGFASIPEAVRAMRSGADDYFTKPINPDEFKLAVRQCLDRRALYTGDSKVTSLLTLLNTCQLISGYLEEEKVFDTVTGYLRRETAAKGVALFSFQGGTRTRVPTGAELEPEVVEVLAESQQVIEGGEEGVPVRMIHRSGSTPDILVFNFTVTGGIRHFVVCIAPTLKTSLEELTSQFRLLQAQIQMTGKNIQNYRGVRGLVYLDEPTGLYNTRYLHVSVDQFVERYEKSKAGFSILFLDVDHFKSVNDKNGHLVGTKILSEMAQIIRRCIRKTDLAFRYGGDEFVMLLDGARPEVAKLIAERIRSEVENTVFLFKEGLNIKLTVSLGVANCPEHATSKREIIEAADGAMYAVKRATRNSVYIAEKKAA